MTRSSVGLAGPPDLLSALTQFLMGMLDTEDSLTTVLKARQMADAERVTQLARGGNLQ